MDMKMLKMDGVTATKTIRRVASMVLNSTVTIMAMTAKVIEGDRNRCVYAGMNDYLAKPVKPGPYRICLLSGRRHYWQALRAEDFPD